MRNASSSMLSIFQKIILHKIYNYKNPYLKITFYKFMRKNILYNTTILTLKTHIIIHIIKSIYKLIFFKN